MSYEKKLIARINETKAFKVLLDLGFNLSKAQSLIDKKRLFCGNSLVLNKNEILSGDIYLIDYEPNPRGLKPIFENEDFAIFDKPSGVLSHPNGRKCTYSISDEIWHLYGKNACVAHRLDFETSGLIMVALNKDSQVKLKKLFENRKVFKIYKALVSGHLKENLVINTKMELANNYNDVKTRMQISSTGKTAITKIKPIKYFKNINATLIDAMPLTGRQHQIRLHLFHIGHKILGENLYGLNKDQICEILDKKMNLQDRINLTGASRLLLHSNELSFEFKSINYKVLSNIDIENEFLKFKNL